MDQLHNGSIHKQNSKREWLLQVVYGRTCPTSGATKPQTLCRLHEKRGPTYCWPILFVMKLSVWKVYRFSGFTIYIIESWWIDMHLKKKNLQKQHSHKVKSTFSGWTNFPQHKFSLGELRPHHYMGEICPFCLPLFHGPSSDELPRLEKNLLINGSAPTERGGRKFLGHFIHHN